MASEATKMAVIDNMHIHVRVFEVTEFNYEVRSDLRGYIIVSPLVFRAIALLFCLLGDAAAHIGLQEMPT